MRAVLTIILLIGLLFTFTSSTSFAKTITVEATGEYLIGDGPNENISVAKARAREEAMRLATEKVGVYVESYSKTNNSALTQDEIRVVAAQVLKILNEKMFPKVTEENHIVWTCELKAVVDDGAINIEKIISNREAVEKTIILEKKIEELQRENLLLKQSYNRSENNMERKNIERKIHQNENEFNQAVYSLPIYSSSGWRNGIDVNSIKYDKANGVIEFTATEINKNNGNKGVLKAKIYVNENAFFYAGMTVYHANGSAPDILKGASSVALEPIEPGTYEEKYQKKLYEYLGITNAPVYQEPQWQYLFKTKFADGSSKSFYVDIANTKYDFENQIVSTYIMSHSDKYGDTHSGLRFYDLRNRTIGYFMREAGKIVKERNLHDYDWDIYKYIEKMYEIKFNATR